MIKHYLFYLSTIVPLWGLASVVITNNRQEALNATNNLTHATAEMDDVLLEISGPTTSSSSSSSSSSSRNVTTSMSCDPDIDPPTITLLVSNISAECSAGLPPSLVPGIDITAFDECDGDISSNIELLQTIAIDEDCSNDNVFQLFVYTYGISDANGNTATVDWIITRVDTQAPVWNDPSLSLTLTAECGDNINALLAGNLPTAMDECALSAVNVQQIEMTSTPLCGNTSEEVYVYRVTDECGNLNPDQYVITVIISDTTPPDFVTAPDQNIIVNTNAGACGATLTNLRTVANDGCGSVSITNDSPFANNPNANANGFYPPGNYLITFTATDNCGNTATYVTNLTVVQPGPPTLVGIPANTISLTCGDPVPTFQAGVNIFAFDGNGVNITGSITTSNNNMGGDCTLSEPLQTINYEFSVTDACGQTTVATVALEQFDTQPPSWNSPNLNLVLQAECGDNLAAILAANLPTATDACGTAIVQQESVSSVPTCGNTSSNTYRYAAIDNCGNTNPDLFTITIQINDTQRPVLSGIPNDIVIGCNDPFPQVASLLANLSALDACDGDLTSLITILPPDPIEDCTPSPTVVYNYQIGVVDGCGNTTTEDFNIIVFNSITVNLGPSQTLCGTPITLNAGNPGLTYEWSTLATTSTIDVTTPGTYSVTVSGGNGCCAIGQVVITGGAGANATAAGGTINCLSSNVQLMGTSTTPGAIYSWTGPNSYESQLQNPVVNTQGSYLLTVTSPDGCTATASTTVIEDIGSPNLTATGGAFTCNNGGMLTLMANSTTPGVTYLWTDPLGVTSTQQNLLISGVTGTYTVVATALNGCTTTAMVVVTDNTNSPALSTTGGTITCTNSSLQLMTSGTPTGGSYSWTGPNNFQSAAQNPIVSIAGNYIVTYTGTNGCTAMATASVMANTTPPAQVMANGGSLNCLMPNVQLTGSSTTPGVTYRWNGPNSFSSNNANPFVTQGGTYILTVTAPNGCTTTATVAVTEDFAVPAAVVATGGTLDCITNTLQLTGSSTTPGVSFAWTGPNMFTSTLQNPTVNTAGSYTLTVTGSNSCTASVATEVLENNGVSPEAAFSFVTDELGVTFSDNSTFNPTTWLWNFGDGAVSMEQHPNHSYITPGTYDVCLTVTNECGENTICEPLSVNTTTIVNFNIGTITGQPGQILDLPVSVENFTDLVSFQKSIHVADPAIARLVGVNNFNLPELDITDFNLVGDETITAAWYSPNGVSIPDGTIIYHIRVELLSTVDDCTTVFIDNNPTPIEVGDINGDTVTIAPYLFNAGEVCVLADVDIIGKVYRETGAPLDEVIVDCTSEPSTITDANGDYSFIMVPVGQPYTITPTRNTNHLDGVTALDLVLIQRHILNVLALDSPYKIIAADVDISGLVSGIDLVKIQQLILNITTEFPDFNSWRFVDDKYTFLNPANPLQETFPEEIDFVNLDRDTLGNDFIAMKLGDVNNSAMGLQAPNGGNLNLVVTETTDVNGDLLLRFRSAEHTTITAYQFDIWFDQHQMQLAEIIPGALPGMNQTFFGRNRLDEGLITTLWYDPTAQVDGWELEAEEVLFTLKFAASNISTSMEERIQTGVATMHSVAYTNTGEAMQIQTNYRSEVVSTSQPLVPTISVTAFKPNPFAAKASLNFYLPEPTEVVIQLLDIRGKHILRQTGFYVSGQQTFQLDGRDLPAEGMYYLVFKAGAFTTTQKVILQR